MVYYGKEEELFMSVLEATIGLNQEYQGLISDI
jgi:hypothetical protein